MELLAPAGSPEGVRAAVQNGADAVYFGGAAFNARRRAKNFTDAELAGAIAYCHRFGVRVYLTFNILVSDRESREADDAARALADMGADALIVQDLGVAARLRQIVPELPLHASTQMSIHSAEGVRAAAALGFSRVVLARELSRREIADICHSSPIECEVFAHGALCAAHSGQCYFSAVVGCRSGNRGLCAQPCRMSYRLDDRGAPQPLLSLSELCMAPHLTELRDMGVSCIKLEGRMRRPEYVALVTSVYAEALRTGKAPDGASLERLRLMFSREGFTDGYYAGTPARRTTPLTAPSMRGSRTEASGSEFDRLCAAVRRSYAADTRPEYPLPAVQVVTRPSPPKPRGVNRTGAPKTTVSVLSTAQLGAVLSVCTPALAYIPLSAVERPDELRRLLDRQVPLAVTLPRVVTPSQTGDVRRRLERCAALGVTDALCGNLGHAALVRDAGLRVHGDFGLNVYNSDALAVLRTLGFVSATASFELRFAAVRDLVKALPVELLVYGRLPLMVLENCPLRASGLCTAGPNAGQTACTRAHTLTDRTGARFPVLPAEGCRTALYNSLPLWLADRKSDWRSLGLWAGRLAFTDESPARCAQVARLYEAGEPCDVPFTRGLYERGVL